MVPDSSPFHDRSVSRRQIIKRGATLAAGGGIVAVAGSSPAEGASADVSSFDLGMQNASHSGKDGSVASVSAHVTGMYEYQAPNASKLTFKLEVASGADATDWQELDSNSKAVSANSGAGEFDLTGSVLDHSELDAATFSADAGEVTTIELSVRVVMEVYSGDTLEATGEAVGVATVEIENTSIQATVQMSADGSLEVSM